MPGGQPQTDWRRAARGRDDVTAQARCWDWRIWAGAGDVADALRYADYGVVGESDGIGRGAWRGAKVDQEAARVGVAGGGYTGHERQDGAPEGEVQLRAGGGDRSIGMGGDHGVSRRGGKLQNLRGAPVEGYGKAVGAARVERIESDLHTVSRQQ